MPRTEVMLIGNIGNPAGFPGAGGPNITVRAPYSQPNYRMNRHMPIPSTWDEPQNLMRMTDKTNHNPHARASGGKPITSALGSIGKKMISPILFGDGESQSIYDRAAESSERSQALTPAPAVSSSAYQSMAVAADNWRTAYMFAAAGTVVLGATMASIHGYRRNKGKTGYAVLWGIAGAVFPILTNGVALVQGYAKPSGS